MAPREAWKGHLDARRPQRKRRKRHPGAPKEAVKEWAPASAHIPAIIVGVVIAALGAFATCKRSARSAITTPTRCACCSIHKAMPLRSSRA